MGFVKSRRGMSPILTTVIMIGIVAVGMSLTFAYFTNYVKDFQLGRGSAIMELIEVEDVWFQDEQTINITLYNYGKVEVEVDSLYIDNLLYNPPDPGDNLVVLRIGEHGEILVELPSALDPDMTYHLKFVTERGSAFEGQYRTPAGW